MLRDSIKSEAYFEEYIRCQDKRIEKFMTTAAALPAAETEKIKKCKRTAANFQRDLIYAKYSAGAEKQELQESYREYLALLGAVGISDYAEYIDVLSIAIVLDISLCDYSDLLDEQECSDALTRLLADDIRSGELGQIEEGALRYEDYYKIFQEYLKGNCTIVQLGEYMEHQWYEASKEFSWYGSHESTEDIYTGYWCWLAAACVKIRKEDADVPKLKYTPLDVI